MSSPYQHIMIAIDFSEQTQRVIDKAVVLAQTEGAKLSICHIVEDFPVTDFVYEPMASVDIAVHESMIDASKEHLSKIGAELSIPMEQQWIESGSPSTTIVKIADENDVDLIVLGSHGRHGIKLLLGSTANSTLHHAHCDVLAVRLKD